MKLQPHGRPLVISALPANNVRLKLYFFEQRGDIADERGVRFIARKHFTPTIDKWIFAGRGVKPSRVQPALQLILDSLHPLETDEIFRGHIVAAVRIRCVTYEEACELRDSLCPFVYICPSALQILFYEKLSLSAQFAWNMTAKNGMTEPCRCHQSSKSCVEVH